MPTFADRAWRNPLASPQGNVAFPSTLLLLRFANGYTSLIMIWKGDPGGCHRIELARVLRNLRVGKDGGRAGLRLDHHQSCRWLYLMDFPGFIVLPLAF